MEVDYKNLLIDKDEVSLDLFLSTYRTRITQESEALFVREFLFPLFGERYMKYVVPQYPFIDSEGRARRIDFGISLSGKKIALEVDGESYHAEGAIPTELFDDSLDRQNEILNAGWSMLRFSYSQLLSPQWREKVSHDLKALIRKQLPDLIGEDGIKPNPLQKQALADLKYYRGRGWKKGLVILPTGTGKTFLSALDSLNAPGRILFIVHKLEILSQSKESFERVYPNEILGLLTGVEKCNVDNSKVLFASKDTLRIPETLHSFKPDEFDYIIVDEVHHGQAPSYKSVLQYFTPGYFMLGLTATPDRMDRKDIFELFDYQKAFEYSLNQAIDDGFLVPYTYYGLTDNIDYTNIRYNGQKYRVEDLDKTLIIAERNERIFEEYLQKGEGNKALGFCCSIRHADAMAVFFNAKGIPSVSITSVTPNRDSVIKDFRENKYVVAFTVDLFNEGVDFPDLRVLMFLRPTESKTVFVQQLGRGLRLCGGKDRVVIIDFIGNYKKANNIRKILSKKSTPKINGKNKRIEKLEYEYSPKCKVVFDAEVEEIMDSQDTDERSITKEDLIGAYYDLREKLNRKPSQEDINKFGEFKVGRYLSLFGSWSTFLREIGELTEFSYHFPQGTHLGHVFYILSVIGHNAVHGSRIDEDNVRFNGGYDEGELGNFQRQTKYKLQACMELGLIVDYRKNSDGAFTILFTEDGRSVYLALKPLLDELEASFNADAMDSWSMGCEGAINQRIRQFMDTNHAARTVFRRVFLKMEAVNLLLRYLYAQQKAEFTKTEIYSDFFNAPFVRRYLDVHGLGSPTNDVVCRRLPFLFNILEAAGVINQERSSLRVLSFVPTVGVVRLDDKEDQYDLDDRVRVILQKGASLRDDILVELRSLYGPAFLTDNYYLSIESV